MNIYLRSLLKVEYLHRIGEWVLFLEEIENVWSMWSFCRRVQSAEICSSVIYATDFRCLPWTLTRAQTSLNKSHLDEIRNNFVGMRSMRVAFGVDGYQISFDTQECEYMYVKCIFGIFSEATLKERAVSSRGQFLVGFVPCMASYPPPPSQKLKIPKLSSCERGG